MAIPTDNVSYSILDLYPSPLNLHRCWLLSPQIINRVALSMYKRCRLAALTHFYRQPEALSTSKLMGLSSFASWLQLQWLCV
jgi:hypothetical protein